MEEKTSSRRDLSRRASESRRTVAGRPIWRLSAVPLQAFSSLAMAIVMRRHPLALERLSEIDEPTFLIEPAELPFAFLLRADASRPRLTVVAEPSAIKPTARIRGPLVALVDLLEGRLDGDALFFSREIAVEGSTEAVVALRNAVDGAGVDIVADLLSVLGPLAAPAGVLAGVAGAALVRARRLLAAARNIVTAPAMRRLDAQAERLRDTERRLAALESRDPRHQRGRP